MRSPDRSSPSARLPAPPERGRGDESVKKPFWRSIRTKILLSHFAAILITVLVTAGISYRLLMDHFFTGSQQDMATHARLAADSIEDELVRLQSALQRVAAGREVADYPVTYRDLALAAYLAKFREVFPVLSYVNPQGAEEVKVVAGEISEQLEDLSSCECFLQARSHPNTVVAVPTGPAPDLGEPAIRIAYGLFNYFGNDFEGAVIASVPLTRLAAAAGHFGTEKNELLVVNADGLILASRQQPLLSRIRLRNPRTDQAEKTGSPGPGFRRLLVNGADAMVAEAGIEKLGLAVLVVQPFAEYLAAPRRLRSLITITLAFICLIGAPPLAFYLSAKISKPLLQVTDAVERLGRGDPQPLTAAGGAGDEIDKLVAAYNRLIENLRQTTISRDYLEGILASMREILVVLDPAGRIRRINPITTVVLGYTEEELAGRPISLIFPDYERFAAAGPGQAHNAGLHEIDCFFRTKEGQELPVLLSCSPMRNGGGETAGFICVALDIRRRKQIEAEKERMQEVLSQAQRLETLGTLTGGIAHSFNNLLVAILGFTALARERIGSEHEIASDLDQVRVAGLRAKELVRQLMDYSRQSEQKKEPVRIQPLMADSIKLLRASTPANIEIRQHLDAGKAVVTGDYTQLQQLLTNLCRNAAQAMEEDGGILEIGLRMLPDGDPSLPPEAKPGSCYLLLTVSDTGHGMDEKTLRRIFDPFFTTRDIGKGTGLGLPVVLGIVKTHQGLITAESKPGEGTTFRVYLPAQAPEEISARGTGTPCAA